jgi:hypothetical protein
VSTGNVPCGAVTICQPADGANWPAPHRACGQFAIFQIDLPGAGGVTYEIRVRFLCGDTINLDQPGVVSITLGNANIPAQAPCNCPGGIVDPNLTWDATLGILPGCQHGLLIVSLVRIDALGNVNICDQKSIYVSL